MSIVFVYNYIISFMTNEMDEINKLVQVGYYKVPIHTHLYFLFEQADKEFYFPSKQFSLHYL